MVGLEGHFNVGQNHQFGSPLPTADDTHAKILRIDQEKSKRAGSPPTEPSLFRVIDLVIAETERKRWRKGERDREKKMEKGRERESEITGKRRKTEMTIEGESDEWGRAKAKQITRRPDTNSSRV
ncbi:hypothetical protein EVAR_19252_1 [Eumeta japonica]|uniref:Uncharacterized protein n=1 Tax=Eumeta variegata TaxID=151549 RepID=A0A4C1UDC8_EUMVA|nr:hypothetical protein EVAR_19252_1 [Eumeta japonica]